MLQSLFRTIGSERSVALMSFAFFWGTLSFAGVSISLFPANVIIAVLCILGITSIVSGIATKQVSFKSAKISSVGLVSLISFFVWLVTIILYLREGVTIKSDIANVAQCILLFGLIVFAIFPAKKG